MATDLLIDASPTTERELTGGVSQAIAPTSAEQGRAVVAANSDASTWGTESTSADRTWAAVANDYVQLTKPRIVVMILVTTIASAMIASASWVAIDQLAWLLIGTAAVAASAGAANQIWERVIDCRMARTASRPLPGGRLRTIPAVIFTAILGIAGTTILATYFGYVPAIVGAATWLLYVLVYTPMKTRTAWNTTVGAIAAALPVLIGYTAIGGTLSQWTGWLLFGVLVAWQYPHFMAIAWMYRRQYAEAGFCMTTTVEPTGRSAGRQSIAGSLAIIGCGISLCFLLAGTTTAVIGTFAVIASCWPMLRASLRFASNPGDVLARVLLRSSLLVLPAVLAIVTLSVFW